MNPVKKNAIFVGIFVALFVIRFYLSSLFFNNDFYNSLNWVKSLKEFGLDGFYQRNFSPWAQVNYPPLINLLHLYFDQLAHFIFGANIPVNILASFYKLPSIILETFLIAYLYINRQKLIAALFALNPAIFYNTIFWGQTEGAVASLIFFSILKLVNNQIIFGFLLFVLALMIKQSALVFLPVILVLLWRNSNFRQSGLGILSGIVLIWLLFLPFNTQDWILYPIRFFTETLGGQVHQHMASVNTFNLWYLLGFNDVTDSTVFGFSTLRLWGQALAYGCVAIIIIKLFKSRKIDLSEFLMAAALINFAIFILLTRVHERHLFPTLIFLLPVIFKKRSNFVFYSLISLVSFINLFWVWYFDHQLNATTYLNSLTTSLLAAINIIGFGYFLFVYLSPKIKNA